MEFRTISGPKALPLPRVQRGGRGFFLGGAFQAVPDPLVEGLVFTPKRCPTFPMDLQPFVEAGVAEGFKEALAMGKRLCCARLGPDLLKYHDVDTTEEAALKRSRSFVWSCLWSTADPTRLHEGWKTASALELARAYRSTSAADTLPVLADALEEAGCDLTFLLDHLRMCPDHGASCWVVDLLLG